MVDVHIFKTIKHRPLLTNKVIEHIVRSVTSSERCSASTVNVHIIGQRRIQTLNSRYRGIMAPTDVLSFETGTSWGEVDEELGDIFLCQEYIRAQAHRFHVSPKEEMIRMLVHGILHLLGYTHEKKKDADRMFSLQEQYVTQSLSVIT